MGYRILLLVVVCIAGIGTAEAESRTSDFSKAERDGAEACMVLRLTDDDGNPVSEASVKVLMGMNYREDSYHIDGSTDTNGVFVIKGKTTGNEIEIASWKDGFYRSKKKLCFVKRVQEFEVANGRWQPWEMKIPLTLRQIRNPVPLLSHFESFAIPTTNVWVGFDMKIGDWVWSGHKGRESDFETCLAWDGKKPGVSEWVRMDIRFAHRDEGYYLADSVIGSSFGGVYNANTNMNYKNEFVFRADRDVSNQGVVIKSIPSAKTIIVRSRCKHDAEGHLIAANYSEIKSIVVGPTWRGRCEMRIAYRFNPIVNDVNLEPKR